MQSFLRSSRRERGTNWDHNEWYLGPGDRELRSRSPLFSTSEHLFIDFVVNRKRIELVMKYVCEYNPIWIKRGIKLNYNILKFLPDSNVFKLHLIRIRVANEPELFDKSLLISVDLQYYSDDINNKSYRNKFFTLFWKRNKFKGIFSQHTIQHRMF